MAEKADVETGMSPDAPAAAAPQPNDGPLFSSFGNRAVCTAFEMYAALLVSGFTIHAMLRPFGWEYADTGPFAFVLLFVYFAGFWASPWGATPLQIAWGSRVVDGEGRCLTLWRATVRSAFLVALIAGALRIYAAPSAPYTGIIAAISFGMLFLAALTPNRQAVHDFLVRSFVVRRAALKSAEGLDRLREATSNRASDLRPRSLPTVGSIVWNTLVLGIPIYAVLTSVNISNDMNMRSRISYAVGETKALKAAIETFHAEHGRLPSTAQELGTVEKNYYPEGGYYHLDTNGRIRIRFTVKSELKRGSIVLTPSFSYDKVTWACAAEGELHRRYLPSSCR